MLWGKRLIFLISRQFRAPPRDCVHQHLAPFCTQQKPKEQQGNVQDKKPKRKKRETSSISSRKTEMMDFISRLPKEIRDSLLLSTQDSNSVGVENTVTGLEYLESYNQFDTSIYYEARRGTKVQKKVLAVPETADKIAQAIIKHSQVINNGASKVKSIISGDSGLCLTPIHLAQNLRQKGIKANIQIIEKTDGLSRLNPKKRLEELNIEVNPTRRSLNILAYHNKQSDGFDYHWLRVFNSSCDDENSESLWDHPSPSCLFVGGANNITMQALAYQCLHRSSKPTIFSKQRIEFFLIMSPFLWSCMHITADQSDEEAVEKVTRSHLYTRSAFLRLLFDLELIEVLPNHHFLPWHTDFTQKGLEKLKVDYLRTTRRSKFPDFVERFYDELFLVRVVPKKDPQLNLDKPNTLTCFLQELYKLSPVHTCAVPKFEKFIPGFGLELIERGYNVMTTPKEISLEDIRYFYNKLVSHPGFNTSYIQALTEVTHQRHDESPHERKLIKNLEEEEEELLHDADES